jgi:deoxyadenosine/deoxycytidine kinase
MIVVVDGNICSGKSRFLDQLATKGHVVHKEPINLWPLQEFYNDPKRWAFTLQVAVLDSLKSVDGYHERCPESSFEIFWDSTLVDPVEDATIRRLHSSISWSPDLYIYLKSSPEKCFERLQTRGQVGDSAVTLEYLRKLHDKYEQFFATRAHVLVDAEASFV